MTDNETTQIITPMIVSSDDDSPTSDAKNGTSAAGGLYDNLPFETLIFNEGTSHKFWEAATVNEQLIIRFGRMGTRGQTQIKTLESNTAAEEEMKKMLAEKRKKGYLPDNHDS